MRKLFTLISGEFIRLYKYKVLQVSLVVTVIWMVIAGLVSKDEASLIAPFLILTDITMMATLLLSASCFFEKQEGTLMATIVTPVRLSSIIAAKYIVYTIYGSISGLLVSIVLICVHGISINIGLVLLYSFLICINSCTLGYIFISLSKDFNTVLLTLMGTVLLLSAPSVVFYLGLIPEWTKYILFLSPYHVAYLLILGAMGSASLPDTLLSIAYLTAVTIPLIYFGVAKRYRAFVLRG